MQRPRIVSTPINHIHQINLTKKEEKQLNSLFDQSQIHMYFNKVQENSSTKAIKKANKIYTQEAIQAVSHDLWDGSVNMKQIPQDIQPYLIEQKISKEEEKAKQLRQKRMKILMHLQYLDRQTSLTGSKNKAMSTPDILQNSKRHVLSKQQHENYIEKTMKDREQKDKKHQERVQRLLSKKKQMEIRKKQREEKMIEKKKETRRKKISQELKIRKQAHERILTQEKRTQKEYNNVKKKKFFHEKVEENYQSQVLVPLLQEKKQKLKEIRQFNHELKFSTLIQHEKEYLKQRKIGLSSRKQKNNDDWNYIPPEKSENLVIRLQSQKLEQKKKLMEKKRIIEENLAKQENFIEKLKDHFRPKIDESKKIQLQEKIKKITYKKRLPPKNYKLLGISYLEQAKKLKKKTDVSQQKKLTEKTTTQSNEPQKTDYLLEMRKNRNYQSIRRGKIQRLINSNEKNESKIEKLEFQSKKLKEAFRRKEELMKYSNRSPQIQHDALDILLTDIKAKMSILQTYKQQQENSYLE